MKFKPVNVALIAFAFAIGTMFTLLGTSDYTQAQNSNAPQSIPDDLSCGKCGMFPAQYPKWQSEIVFDDGKMAAFDGCKCMFGYIFNMEQFDPQHKKENMTDIWVRDFNSGEWINGKIASYVIGSDMMGPMGKELIPFTNQKDAESFLDAHGGQLASFDDITEATLKPLMGKMHMKGPMKMDGKKDQ